MKAVAFALARCGPPRDADGLIAEAVEAARNSDTAVVAAATTERVESEGHDRRDLRLPGRKNDLVHAAAADPDTAVVGFPVGLFRRDEVAAILLAWFPGHEGGGRLPTTWGALADAPVTQAGPVHGELPYGEDLFIGYRAWDRPAAPPRTPSATASAAPTGPTRRWRPTAPPSASAPPSNCRAAPSSRGTARRRRGYL